jgi:hypothetical protein
MIHFHIDYQVYGYNGQSLGYDSKMTGKGLSKELTTVLGHSLQIETLSWIITPEQLLGIIFLDYLCYDLLSPFTTRYEKIKSLSYMIHSYKTPRDYDYPINLVLDALQIDVLEFFKAVRKEMEIRNITLDLEKPKSE